MRIEERTRKKIVEVVENLRSAIIQNHASAGQIASGETERSVRVEPTQTGAKLIGRSFFKGLETGRKGGKVPANFQDIITQWILNKGIAVTPIPYIRQESARFQPKYTPEQRGLMSLSGMIAYSIRKNGTKLHIEGGRTDIFTPEIEEAKKELRNILVGIYRVEIEGI